MATQVIQGVFNLDCRYGDLRCPPYTRVHITAHAS